MKFNIPLCLLIMFGFNSISVQAQQEPQYSQFWLNKSTYNAAYTGLDHQRKAQLLGRFQWLALNGPITFNGMYNQRLNPNHSIGFNGTHDEIGGLRNQKLNLNYSYRLALTSTSHLAAGFYVGYQSIKYPDWLPPDGNSNDPSLPSTGPFGNVNSGIGIAYADKKFTGGFSFSQLNRTSFGSLYQSTTHFYLNTSYRYDFNPDLSLTTHLLYKSIFTANSQLSVASMLEIKDKIQVGAGHRQSGATSIYAGYRINDNININYGLDALIFGVVGTVLSHEIAFTIQQKAKSEN